MFLSVKQMELQKIRFDETLEPGQIEFASENLEQVSPLHAVGSAEVLKNSGGEIRIQGRYTLELKAICDRCLVETRFPLDAGFDLFYQPASVIARDEEIEIDAGEAEIGFYEDGGLELEDVLREQVLLALPMQRVCSENCKGICPVCGKNRNQSACDCPTRSADDRWVAFRDLKI
jgi:uncharacterized protein